MKAVTYILQCSKDNKTYVGSTNDFIRRLKQHNAGQVKSTKYRIPLRVLFTEEFETLAEARKRETWWKSGTGRRKLKEYFDSKTSN